MIHTSRDEVLALFDRKSKRHGWGLAGSGDQAHLDCLAWGLRAGRSTQGPGWEGYQQKIVRFDTSATHTYPDSLPVGDQQGEIIQGG